MLVFGHLRLPVCSQERRLEKQYTWPVPHSRHGSSIRVSVIESTNSYIDKTSIFCESFCKRVVALRARRPDASA